MTSSDKCRDWWCFGNMDPPARTNSRMCVNICSSRSICSCAVMRRLAMDTSGQREQRRRRQWPPRRPAHVLGARRMCGGTGGVRTTAAHAPRAYTTRAGNSAQEGLAPTTQNNGQRLLAPAISRTVPVSARLYPARHARKTAEDVCKRGPGERTSHEWARWPELRTCGASVHPPASKSTLAPRKGSRGLGHL